MFSIALSAPDVDEDPLHRLHPHSFPPRANNNNNNNNNNSKYVCI